MSINIARRIEQIEDLPSMPHSLQKILESMDSVAATADSLEEFIKDDPVLSTNILRTANSPYYGMSGEISSLSRALVIMGFEEVKNLVIGLSLTSTFSGDTGVDIFTTKQLWLHSVGVARASQAMAELIPELDSDALFTAGLMHDIGKFLLCIYFSQEFNEVIDLYRQKQIPFLQAEKEYGLSHAEAGAFLSQKWAMSEMLVNVVRYHHHPVSAGPHSQAASVVFLADQICHKLQIGGNMGNMPEKIKVPKNIGIPPDRIKSVAQDLKKNKKVFEDKWGAAIK